MAGEFFTAHDKRLAVERELAYRRRQYTRWIENKVMTRAYADRLLALFEDIRRDYIAAEEAELLTRQQQPYRRRSTP